MDENRSKTASLANNDKPRGFRELLLQFCSECSAHGLPHMVRYQQWSLLRYVWLCIFLMAMLGKVTHVLLMTLHYLSYPSVDSFRVSKRQPTFPAITVCNSHPLSELGLKSSDSTADKAAFDRYYYRARNDVPVNWNDDYAFFNRINSAKGMFENVDLDKLQSLGHQLEDLVMFCSYRGVRCDYTRDFTRIESATYFNCYTYQAPANVPVGVGPDKGITFVLFLEGDIDDIGKQRYFTRDSHVEQTFGARMELHEPGTLPNPVLNGINILPGHHTSLVLHQSERKILGQPYTDCEEGAHLEELSEYKYSSKGCFSVCKAMYIYDECGCVNPETPMPDSLRHLNVSYCGTYNTTYTDEDEGVNEWFKSVHCEIKAQLNFSTEVCDGTRYFTCNEPCLYSHYGISISQSVWPSLIALQDTYYDYVRSNKAKTTLKPALDAPENSSTRAKLRDYMWYNLARVNIYFNEARLEETEEQEAMSLTELFANIGGVLGLWAGLSIITVLEFLSLPFHVLYLYISKRAKHNVHAGN